jgi:hypothetical protein
MFIFFSIHGDVQFLSYPLVLITCISNFFEKEEQGNKKTLNIGQLLIFFIILTPLGLLPLIKGSLLVLCVAFITINAGYFFYLNHRILGFLTIISPIASMLIFWVLSGQSLSFLPDYLYTQIPIISGYTEAMALQGNTTEIVAYIFASIAIVWSLITANNITLPTRLFLSIYNLLFLLIAFKAGFTRHDDHANIAAVALLFAALTLCLCNLQLNRRIIALAVPIIVTVYIFFKMPIKDIFDPPYFAYINSWNGIRSRLTENNDNNLQLQFKNSLELIRQKYPIPTLQGTTDIYPSDQSYILASNNQWNPRPIIQSYSAYTPLLARINEQHLRADNAPDNVLFKVDTIDNRFSTLDDGLSWPALLDNYTVNKIDNDFKFIYLQKKPILQKDSVFNVLHEDIHKINESVAIPSTDKLVYMEINVKPTLLGKILSILYKPPQLLITLKLKDGRIVHNRVIANMMESGFFISPLIKDTKDFAIVASGGAHYLNQNIVESFTISYTKGRRLFWNSNYQLKLKAYQMPITNNAVIFPFDEMTDLPEKYICIKETRCQFNQQFDLVNSSSTDKPKLTAQSLLSVDGWLVFSVKDGIAADETFVTLTDAQGNIKYVKIHHTVRPDIKEHFKQPALPKDVGFTASVDVSKLQGDYTLGLARAYDGKLEKCIDSIIPITIKPTIHHESQ